MAYNSCPYCKSKEFSIYEDPPGDIHIACHSCGRGPKEALDIEDVSNGRAMEAWIRWCVRKRNLLRKKQH